jgi:hypothetical protein
MEENLRRKRDAIADELRRSLDDTALPPIDWAKIARGYKTAFHVTVQEKELVKSLGRRMTVEVEGKPLKEVLDHLKEKTGQPIRIDEQVFDDPKVTARTPITLNLRNVTTRTVLRRLLGDLGLTYIVKDQTIMVTTPARAREMLTTRVYSVADLMPLVDKKQLPAVHTQLQANQMLEELVELITQTVEPDSWELNGKGGVGTIRSDPIRFSLIVKQSVEIHYLLGLSAVR